MAIHYSWSRMGSW